MMLYLYLMEKLNKFLAKKGQICSVVIEKPVKTRKGFDGVITKTTKMVVRAGVAYDNIAAVKEGRENGTLPAENAGLPWGQWKIFPHVISHKGRDYFRFSKLNGGKIETVYTLNGQEIARREVEKVALASEFKSGGDFEVITVSEENVKEIV